MLRRKIYDKLLEWKKNRHDKCLIVKGARQVGKTYIIEEFGKKEYKNFISINFMFNPEMKNAFGKSLEVDDILLAISLYRTGCVFEPGETLFFFDEIQLCPLARTALKSFALDGRFDVIVSGSLLGLHFGQDVEIEEELPPVPVGFEEEVFLHSLDFEEFLWAVGIQEETIARLKTYMEREEPVPDEINNRMMDLFRSYAVVGGMPRAVLAFIEEGNINSVHREQMSILNSYDDDITRHARRPDKLKILRTLRSIPNQLAKENTKFQYSTVEPKATGKRYESSVEWLYDASIVYKCTNVALPFFPLEAYRVDSYFKLYMNDIGLLGAMMGFHFKATVIDKTLSGPMKGGFYENLIGCLLARNGHPLCFYKPAENGQEIEFLIERDDATVAPIEVKARNGATKSLNEYIEKYKPPLAYKLIDGNIGREGCKLTLPHYFVIFL